MQPIAVPTLSPDEIREVTRNFGNDNLIGEGSYARVYYGALRNGRKAAIKKLDSSKQPDQEFLSQVHHSFIYLFLFCKVCPQGTKSRYYLTKKWIKKVPLGKKLWVHLAWNMA
jgi:hypothetical protein